MVDDTVYDEMLTRCYMVQVIAFRSFWKCTYLIEHGKDVFQQMVLKTLLLD